MYTRKQFIDKLAPDAVRSQAATQISAALTIAQGCLESANGNSALTLKANNLFGKKGTGPAGSVTMNTREQRKDGSVYVIPAAFCAYNNWEESVLDHAKLLVNGLRSEKVNRYRAVIGAKGKEAARAVAAAGYATDIKYADKLIGIMDSYNLYQYETISVEKQEETPTAVKLYFNGLRVADAYNKSGTSYVAIRELKNLLNASVGFDNATKKASVGGRVLDDTLMIGNMAYGQLRPLVESFGAEVVWDGTKKSIHIVKG